MAASGEFTKVFTNNSSFRLRLKYWETGINITNNTTVLNTELYIDSITSWGTVYDGTSNAANITINGNTKSSTATSSVGTAWGSKHLVSHSTTITHNSDGTKVVWIEGYHVFDITWNGAYVGGVTVGGNVTLETIPRASTLSGGQNFTLGFHTTLTLSRASSDFTHTVYVDVQDDANTGNAGYTNIASATNVTTSVDFIFNQAQQEQMATLFRNKGNPQYINTRINLYTYNGATLIGSNTTYGTIGRPSESLIETDNNFELSASGFQYLVRRNSSTAWLNHSLRMYTGSFTKTITLSNSSPDSGIFPLTQADVESIYSNNTTKTWCIFNIEIVSFIGTVKIGSSTYRVGGDARSNFNLDAISPVLSGTPTYSDINSTITSLTGNNQYIVQNKSTLRVSIPANAGTTKFGATALSYSIIVSGASEKTINYTTSATSVDVGLVDSSSSSNIQLALVDSRGLVGYSYKAMNVVPYTPPSIRGIMLRTDGFEVETNISATGSVSPVNILSVNKNSISYIRYRYKESTTTTYGAYSNLTGSLVNGVFTTNVVTNGTNFDNTLKYDFEFEIKDAFGSIIPSIHQLNAGKPILFIDAVRRSVGVNKFSDNYDTFEVAGGILLVNKENVADTKLIIAPTYGQSGIEIGGLGRSNTPYVDFHSGSTATDYDARIVASGGNGTNGGGVLDYAAATHNFSGDIVTPTNILTPKLLPSGNGSIAYWLSVKGGTYFASPGILTGQPTDHGFVVVSRYGNDYSAIWYPQTNGKIFRLGGNATSMTTWHVASNGNESTVRNLLPLGTGIWHYVDKSGGGYQRVTYSLTLDKEVTLSGLAYMESGYRSDSTLIGTLPVGCRPSGVVIASARNGISTCRINIYTDGTVRMQDNGTSDWISLTGISFPAA